jgi:uncharacterized repeat protein (TIGR03803 family)
MPLRNERWDTDVLISRRITRPRTNTAAKKSWDPVARHGSIHSVYSQGGGSLPPICVRRHSGKSLVIAADELEAERYGFMRGWLFHTLRNRRRNLSAQRRAAAPAVRSSRFEQLEERRLLTAGFQTLASFNGTNGDAPRGDLTLSADGSTLYGMTEYGGAYSDGTIFSIPVTGGAPTTLLSFDGTNGSEPYGGLTLSADGSTLYGMTTFGGTDSAGTIFSIPVTGGTPTVLASFDGTNGGEPYGSLTLSTDGSTLYGMTAFGGQYGEGAIFSIPVTGGTPTTLASFNGTDGEEPDGSLTLSGSTLYGMTVVGGAMATAPSSAFR